MAFRKSEPRSAKPDRSRVLRRGLIRGAILVFWMLALVARLYHLQVIEYVDLVARAQRQQRRTIEVAPQRGVIYDRQLNPLAMSLGVESVYAVPSEIPDKHLVATLLAPVLNLDRRDLEGRLTASRTFCWVERKVSSAEAKRVQALNLKGIYFQRETKRFYPKGDLAAQVIGYVGMDDTGLGGLEYALNGLVQGKPGRVLLATDARRHTFSSTEWPGQPGKNVVLTLDENIQYIAEKALAAAVEKWHAADGVAIVQNPNTGEILALANEPTFNPNDYSKSPQAAFVNRAVGWIYEPGSTFKLVTVSAALEEKLANPQEVVNCQNGAIVLAGHVIHDHKPYGDLTVTDVLVHSSDVGAIKIGLRLGEDRLYRYIRNFGFDSKTNIELPGEEKGLFKPPSRWSGISIGEISMGQEIGVTPLQLVTAYSAIANGGILFEPRILHDVFLGQQHDPLPPVIGRRVVSGQTAEEMRRMLTAVVERGTGTPAQLAGYTAAGKTGTAQKIDASGTYSKSHYIASFVGFAPAEHPAVTILVVIDSPVGAIYGTEVAAPVFRTIAEQTLGYLNVPQDNPSRWPQISTSTPDRTPAQKRGDPAGPPTPDSVLPGVATSPVRAASFSTAAASETYSASPDSDALPASGTQLLGDGPLVAVPDFSGLPARQVAEACQKLGLELTVTGTGLAVKQIPVAHDKVPMRSKVWVRMAR